MSALTRVALSVAVFVAAVLANVWLSPHLTTMSADLAGQQFQNSDLAYQNASVGLWTLPRLSVTLGLALVIIALIWWPFLRRMGRLTALLVIVTAPAQAYYDKTDYTEAVTIYPNETAFWIPDNGGNKDSQGRFDSADYYQNNRVAVKRFIIPHTQLSGSGWGPWGNYFVPSGRLILVDRTPYNQEWVKAQDRGSSARDESFPCQDNQGKDVTVEITIGVSVSEDNAAKFLYHFGVKPPVGERNRPEIVFTSVFYGRSLSEVMPSTGRGVVQALACSQISIRDLDHVNAEAAEILTTIRDEATKQFANRGITLDYIGWAGTFTFAPDVQNAINRRYIAEQDQRIATMLAPHTGVIRDLAVSEAIRAFGVRSDGHLPATLVGVPLDIGTLVRSLTSPGAAGPAQPAQSGTAPTHPP